MNTTTNICHLARLPYEQAQRYMDRTVFMHQQPPSTEWKNVTWQTFAQTVNAVSKALLANHTEVEENVAVFAPNMAEVYFATFGAYGIRAAVTPFYPTSSIEQVKYMIEDAHVRTLFVGEQRQYDIAFPLYSIVPHLERLIIFDRSVQRHPADHLSVYFDEFVEAGRAANEYQAEAERRRNEAKAEDLCDILYTSGTTGASKGVMLTHANYMAAVEENANVLELTEQDTILNFLPLTHVFERGWSYLSLSTGCTVAICRNPANVQQCVKEVRPTCMSAVPRFWEKVYEGVLETIAQSPAWKQQLFRQALKVARRHQIDYRRQLRNAPLTLSLQYKFYDRAVFSLVRKTLGLDRGNFFPTAGAAISKEVETFVHICGINMVKGYGLTESTATVSCDHAGKPFSLGSAGRPIGGVQVKISDDGEVLLRGRGITLGYYRKPEANAEAFTSDGWFRTGDAGYISETRELFLTDRIKDLYKTSNGKYIAPGLVESKLIVDKYIDQIMVVADRYKFVSALIVPAFPMLEKWAAEHGIAYADHTELCQNQRVIDMLHERIDTLQQSLANYEQVKHFVLLPEPFSMARGEVTNTLKMKRKVILEHYKAQIDQLYK